MAHILSGKEFNLQNDEPNMFTVLNPQDNVYEVGKIYEHPRFSSERYYVAGFVILFPVNIWLYYKHGYKYAKISIPDDAKINSKSSASKVAIEHIYQTMEDMLEMFKIVYNEKMRHRLYPHNFLDRECFEMGVLKWMFEECGYQYDYPGNGDPNYYYDTASDPEVVNYLIMNTNYNPSYDCLINLIKKRAFPFLTWFADNCDSNDVIKKGFNAKIEQTSTSTSTSTPTPDETPKD